MIGQSALENEPLLIDRIPEDYLRITSGLGSTAPRAVLIFPFAWNDRVEAVVELGTVHEFSELHRAFLDKEAEGIAITVAVARSRKSSDEDSMGA
ncbi:MAG: GAF domain-containing protein [bacterium]|nr:GAF domain-containing protein [bacterium]